MNAPELLEKMKIRVLPKDEWSGHLARINDGLRIAPEVTAEVLMLLRSEEFDDRLWVSDLMEALTLSRELGDFEAMGLLLYRSYPIAQVPRALRLAAIDEMLHGFMKHDVVKTPEELADYLRVATKQLPVYAGKASAIMADMQAGKPKPKPSVTEQPTLGAAESLESKESTKDTPAKPVNVAEILARMKAKQERAADAR